MKKNLYHLTIIAILFVGLTIQPQDVLKAVSNTSFSERSVGVSNSSGQQTDFRPISDPYLLLTNEPDTRNCYFCSNWPGGDPSEATWVIYFQSATLNGQTLKAGDEIAIFHGDTPVGVSTLTGVPSPNTFQQYVLGFSWLADETQGYVPGEAFTMKCYDSDNELQSEVFNVTFHNPYGDAYTPDESVFPSGFQQYSIVSLAFDAISCPPDYEVCCNEGPFDLDQGLPTDGEYSGDFVTLIGSDYYFDPGCNNIGNHLITYSYENPINSMVYSCTFTITVHDKPAIDIYGDDGPVCPGTYSYSGPPGLVQYDWEIDGNGTITGTFTGSSVEVFAGPLCGESFTLTLTGTDDNGCSETMSKTVMVDVVDPLIILCPGDVNIGACTPLVDIQTAYEDWKNEFDYVGGCTVTTNIGNIPLLPADVFCNGANLAFVYVAEDQCSAASCTSTFSVAPAPPVSVICPGDVNIGECTPLVDIQSAYETWKGGFEYFGGCTVTTNIGNIPSLPADVFCNGANLTFVYVAEDQCSAASCTSTFIVEPATPVSVICPGDVNIGECTPLVDIQSAYETWKGGFEYFGGCTVTTNIGNIPSLPADVFCNGANLTFVYVAEDQCSAASCTSTFIVEPATPVSVICPGDVNIGECTPLVDIQSAYETWKGGFEYFGGCTVTTNIGNIPSLPADVFCNGANLTFVYVAEDQCSAASCTSTFIVEPATPVSVICPGDVNIGACTPLVDIQSAYETWKGGFEYFGGCTVTTNIGNIPSLPADVFCNGANLTFVYVAEDQCSAASCTSTFIVEPATPVSVICPGDVNIGECTPLVDIQSAYETWKGGFEYFGGCTVTTNIGNIPSLPADVFCNGANLTFVYVAEDQCSAASCTSTFIVEPATPVSVICPGDVNIGACTPLVDIQSAYETWKGGFEYFGGCTVTTNIGNIPSLPADVFCNGANLTFVYVAEDQCSAASCTSTFIVEPATPVSVICPGDVNIGECTPLVDIQSAYETWKGGFEYFGGCTVTTNIGNIPSLPADVFCNGANLTFVYVAEDQCSAASCTSTFSVAPAPPVSVICPGDVNIGECTPLVDIQSAYETWKGGFEYFGGCTVTTNIGNIPSLPADVFCNGANLTFVYVAEDQCSAASCTSTFIVEPATPVSVICPGDVNIGECTPLVDIQSAYETWKGGFEYFGGCTVTTNIGNIPSLPADVFCNGANLTFVYVAEDQCSAASCTSTFIVEPATPVSVICPGDVNIGECTPLVDIQSAYETWKGGFEYFGGCTVTTNIGNIPSLPADVFCNGANLTFVYVAEDQCSAASCTSTFIVEPATPVSVICPGDVNIGACTPLVDIQSAYETWKGGFEYFGGCTVTTNIGNIPSLPADVFCNGANLTFVYVAEDQCSAASCTSTFIVEPATPVSVICPGDVNIGECTPLVDIQSAYETWKGGFEYFGGCTVTTNIGNIPSLPADVFCNGANLTFVYVAEDQCSAASCTSTFSVAPAPPVSVICPGDVNIGACTPLVDIQSAYETWKGGFEYFGGCTVTTNIGNIPSLPADVFCNGANLTFVYVAEDQCSAASCTSTFIVEPATPVSVICPGDVNIGECTPLVDIQTAYQSWKDGFDFVGGCTVTTNIGDIPLLPADAFCNGADLTFVYVAEDQCSAASCTSSFIVAPSPDIVLSLPSNYITPAGLTQTDIDNEFSDWLSNVALSGGCNATMTISPASPQAPDICGGESVVTWTVTSSCEDDIIESRTFTVPAYPVVVCPDNVSVCCDSDPIFLPGLTGISPSGGDFSGVGVVSSIFTPDCSNTGTFLIYYSYSGENGCTASCSFTITVNNPPIASAGNDATIFCGESYTLTQATASNYSSIEWTTSGFGNFTFNNSDLLKATYTPVDADCNLGSVILTLTAFGLDGCPDVTSSMKLTIITDSLPIMAVEPLCIKHTLMPDAAAQRELIIKNEGYVDDLIFAIDIMPASAGWLSAVPTSGTIARKSFKIINLSLDATGIAAGETLTATITITGNDPNNSTVLIPVELNVMEEFGFEIPLYRGWSIISSPVMPSEPLLDSVFKNQVVCSTLIIGINTQGIFWPSQAINTIGNWTADEGIKIKMYVKDQLLISGDQNTLNSIALNEGTNYLPIPTNCPVEVVSLFNQINNKLLFAIDIADQTAYWPQGGIFTLEYLLPGRGYLLIMVETATLTFPECNKSIPIMTKPPTQNIDAPWSVANTGSPHIISIDKSVLEVFEPDDVIAAFNSAGLCVGMSLIENKNHNLGLVVNGNDFTTAEIDGMLENEYIQLKVYRPSTNETFEMDVIWDPSMPDYTGQFREFGLSAIKAAQASGMEPVGADHININIFPNPTKDQVIVSIDMFDFSNAGIKIYRIDGSLVLDINTNERKNYIDVTRLKSGVYVVRVDFNGKSVNKRLIIK
jgi:hypothetical protein